MPSPYQPCFQRRIKKKGKQRRPDENGVVKKRKAIQTETAPHILAALQAQRERVAQQQANDSGRGGDKSDDNTFAFLKRQQRPQQQTSLPGFLFDKEHGRFFKLVRGGAAHPAQVSATQRPARGLPNLGESRALAGGAPKVSPAEGGRVGHDAIRKRGQGLHAYVVHRRTGWFGDSSWNPRAAGVARGGWRRAAVESVACSSRFQAKQSLRLSCDNDVCTIAYNPEREMVAFGSSSGRVCLLTPRDHGSIYSSDGPRVIREYGSEDMVQWSQANGYGQVSDISFAEYDKGCCYAFSWLGSAGRPGQVRAYFPRTQSDGDGAGVPLESTRQPSHHEVHIEVGRGSAWCAEYDPRSPARLAIGTSTVFPVSMYDTERSHLEPIAKLSSDVFSISFAPPDAPGAGDAIALGLRNGTVRLLDPRKPWHGGRPTDVLARLGSSIDHVRMLRDGRRCLIRDQSGGLQMYDVRVPEREPLRVLVPSNPGRMRPFCRGKFVLDPSETVVASPVGRRVGSTAVVGRGEGAEPTGVAQGEDTSMCPFVRNPRRRYVRPPRSDQTQSHRVEVGAPVIDGRESATLREEAKGERVRLLSLTTGGILSDLATPWDRLSVARGVTGASGACHSEGDFCFLGIGSGSGDGGQARVFEARLWPEVDSGADAQ